MLNYQRFKQIDEFFAQGRHEEARRLLMELQSRHIALNDQINSLKAQVREFEDVLFLSRCLHFDGRFYWVKIADREQGPFCPQCRDRDGSLIRLGEGAESLLCPYCGEGYPLADDAASAAGELHPCRARRIPFAR